MQPSLPFAHASPPRGPRRALLATADVPARRQFMGRDPWRHISDDASIGLAVYDPLDLFSVSRPNAIGDQVCGIGLIATSAASETAAYAVSEVPQLRAAPIRPASAIIVSTPTKPHLGHRAGGAGSLAPFAPRINDSTALLAKQYQSFRDNGVAHFQAARSSNYLVR